MIFTNLKLSIGDLDYVSVMDNFITEWETLDNNLQLTKTRTVQSNTLTVTGTYGSTITLTLPVPYTLDADSLDSVDTTGHSHSVPKATTQDAQGGLRFDVVMTPLKVSDQIDARFANAIESADSNESEKLLNPKGGVDHIQSKISDGSTFPSGSFASPNHLNAFFNSNFLSDVEDLESRFGTSSKIVAPDVYNNKWGRFASKQVSKTVGKVMQYNIMNWEIGTAPANQWNSVAWSPELKTLVAVASTGTNRVMTSRNGTNWSSVPAAEQNEWLSVTWSSKEMLFVAVGIVTDGTTGIMTSPDGVTWTSRSAPVNNDWRSIVYSEKKGIFVVVASSGTGTTRVITSSNGINWNSAFTEITVDLQSVTYSPELGIFVAVASSGDARSRAWYSDSGLVWEKSANLSPATIDLNSWVSVEWSSPLSRFVAVSTDGANRVMVSYDGFYWNAFNAGSPFSPFIVDIESEIQQSVWRSVKWSDDLGLFVAVASAGTNRIATSYNGVDWVARQAPEDREYRDVTWSQQLGAFVSVATGRSMRSP